MPGRQWIFFDKVYSARYHLFHCSYDIFRSQLKHIYGHVLEDSGNKPGGMALHIEWQKGRRKGQRTQVLWISRAEDFKAPDSLAVLVHEVVHVALYVLMSRGLNASKEDHEAYAYYIDYLFTECLLRFRHRR